MASNSGSRLAATGGDDSRERALPATGLFAGGPDRGARQVIGLGTSNRNIALALLLALQAFGGTEVVAAVVANGLLLILLGLIHVAFWRFRCQRARE